MRTERHASADLTDSVIHLPSVRGLVKRASGHIAEAALVPAVTFYVVLTLVNLRWAVVAGLCWAYLLTIVRLTRRKRVPGLLLVSAGILTVRAIVAWSANSAFIYFLQPCLSNVALAVVFTASLARRPLIHRLADDFCPMPASITAHPGVKRLFVQLTVFWALLCAINGGATLLLLMNQSIGAFLAIRPLISYGLVASGAVASYLWFRRTARTHGIRIVFGPRLA
jgi:uncharacterized membrane protein